jgi:transposase
MIKDIWQTGGMSRIPARITCNEDDRRNLEVRAASRTEAKQTVERARMILGCLAGDSVTAIAERCQTRPNTVIKWRQRFAEHGLKGLADAPRPGAKPVYDQAFRNRVLATLEQPPPSGQAVWDGPAVAKRVNGSVHAVWRVLRKEGVCLQRQRSWCVSTDKQFAAKAADIIALYLNPPEKALVISVDEKPSIQALERAGSMGRPTTARSCEAAREPTNVMALSICSQRCTLRPAPSQRARQRSSGTQSSCSS